MCVAMTSYWCKFLDGSGRIVSAEAILASNDDDVIAKVAGICVPTAASGFEIRQGQRLVAWTRNCLRGWTVF